MSTKLIAESVTYMHPDKICDQISDAILDAYLTHDPNARVAVECAGGHGHLALFGEITSSHEIDHEKTAQDYYKKLTGQNIAVASHISRQSPEIAQGVNNGGAGDQGIMIGYACNENDQFIPQEMYLARKLLQGFNADGFATNGFCVDGKSQVTVESGKITSIVLSVQGKSQNELIDHVLNSGISIDEKCVYANNTGTFETGGFDADSGCTGRKIVVDSYGPRVPVGGGAFSGKDATKVDRSAAYMARWIALQLLHKHGADEVYVKLGYVIGCPEPLIQSALVDAKETDFTYDCRPEAIIERFDLRKPVYTDCARWGHFGMKRAWER